MNEIKIITYNIHKGLNWNNEKVIIHSIKTLLQEQRPNVVFLQEIVGEHKKNAQKYPSFPENQIEYLAEGFWRDFVYSRHAVFDYRDHGNAILSSYPIIESRVFNISENPLEQRAIMWAKLETPNGELNAYNVHLNLLHKDRKKQYKRIFNIIEQTANNAPVILAGDFNDWNKGANQHLCEQLDLTECHQSLHQKMANTYPSLLPFLSLDRIYVHGLIPIETSVLNGHPWNSLSDHLPLTASCSYQGKYEK